MTFNSTRSSGTSHGHFTFPSPAPKPQGFRPFAGLVPLSSPSASTVSLAGSKASSTPQRNSFFKSFSKYRSRRLSDGSLTDLSPPTDADLGLNPVPQSPSSPGSPSSSSVATTATRMSLFSSSPTYNTLALGSSRKDFKGSSNSSQMSLLRSDSISSTVSSGPFRLRMLSSKNSEKNCRSNQPDRPEPQSHPKSSFSIGRLAAAVRKPQGKAPHNQESTKPALPSRPHNSTDLPLESPGMLDPRLFLSSRSLSMERARSSSSPNLIFPSNSFSHRPSMDSNGTSTPTCIQGSPRKGRVPPPIKVPKLKGGGLTAVSADGKSSPAHKTLQNSGRHRSTGSEGNLMDRRFAGIDWPVPPRRDFSRSKSASNDEPKSSLWPQVPSELDAFEDLASPCSRSIHISICSPNKLTPDRLPGVQSLQPPPRKLPPLSISNNEPRSKPLPLLISKHTRSPGQGATRFTPSTSPTPSNGSTAPTTVPTSVESSQISKQVSAINLTISHQFLQRTPHYSGPSLPSESEKTQKHSLPNTLPFPTSSKKVDSENQSTSDETLAQSPLTPLGCHPCLGRRSSSPTELENPQACNEDSCKSATLPKIAIPQSVAIPKLISKESCPPRMFSPDSTVRLEDNHPLTPESNLCRCAIKPLLSEQGRLRSARSDISSTSSSTTNRFYRRVSNSSSSCDSDSLAQLLSKYHSPAQTFDDNATSVTSPNSRLRSLSTDGLLHMIGAELRGRKSSCGQQSEVFSRPRSLSDSVPGDPVKSMFAIHLKAVKSMECGISPTSTNYPSPLLPLFSTPIAHRSYWETRSIEAQTRMLAQEDLKTIIEKALGSYPLDSHRFVVGDVTKLNKQTLECEKKVNELHVQYLSGLTKRDKLLQRHLTALRAFNGDEGGKTGELLAKAISQSDNLACELLSMIGHTSRIAKLCEGHWRAAAMIHMSSLSLKATQVESSQAQVELLKEERRQHLAKISELEAKLESVSPRSGETEPAAPFGGVQSAPIVKRGREGVIFRPTGFVFPSSTAPTCGYTPWSNVNNLHQSSNTLQPGFWRKQSKGSLTSVTASGSSSMLEKFNMTEGSPTQATIGSMTDSLEISRENNLGPKSIAHQTRSSSTTSIACSFTPTLEMPLSHARVKSFESIADGKAQLSIKPQKTESPLPPISKLSNKSATLPTFVNPFSATASQSLHEAAKNKKNGVQLGFGNRGIFSLNQNSKNYNNTTVISSDVLPILPGIDNSAESTSTIEIKAPCRADSSTSNSSVFSAVIPCQQSACENKQETEGADNQLDVSLELTAISLPRFSLNQTDSNPDNTRISLMEQTSGSFPTSQTSLDVPASRRRPKWAAEGNGGNLSSITLSQLGSLDIANLLSDLQDESVLTTHD